MARRNAPRCAYSVVLCSSFNVTVPPNFNKTATTAKEVNLFFFSRGLQSLSLFLCVLLGPLSAASSSCFLLFHNKSELKGSKNEIKSTFKTNSKHFRLNKMKELKSVFTEIRFHFQLYFVCFCFHRI